MKINVLYLIIWCKIITSVCSSGVEYQINCCTCIAHWYSLGLYSRRCWKRSYPDCLPKFVLQNIPKRCTSLICHVLTRGSQRSPLPFPGSRHSPGLLPSASPWLPSSRQSNADVDRHVPLNAVPDNTPAHLINYYRDGHYLWDMASQDLKDVLSYMALSQNVLQQLSCWLKEKHFP